MGYLRAGDEAAIGAYFGSRAEWEAIGDWSTFVPPTPGLCASVLEHGYDETVTPGRWGYLDLAGAAEFRGGALVSPSYRAGDIGVPLRWRCGDGHEFSGSPRLILSAGHWCPECVRDPAGYDRQADVNRFLAQVQK